MRSCGGVAQGAVHKGAGGGGGETREADRDLRFGVAVKKGVINQGGCAGKQTHTLLRWRGASQKHNDLLGKGMGRGKS